MSTVNPAVRAHLSSIFSSERVKTLRIFVRLRAVLLVGYVAQTLYHVARGELPEMRETLKITLPYMLFAVLWAALIEFSPQALKWSGYSIPLIDIPSFTAAGFLATPFMAHPEYSLNSLLPFMATAVMMSTLALDYRVIALSTVSSVLAATYAVQAVGCPVEEIEDPVYALSACGALAAFIVSRLQTLVQESRRKDFAGKYLLGDRLGSGGMAEVFVATYSPEGSFERRVAVKRVLPAFAENRDFIALFRREAEIGAQLAHPNLVQVLDFGRHLDSWFLAMELIEGTTLGRVLSETRDEQLPMPVCLYVIAEVAEGLAYLHEKRSADGAHVGLVHRDLNPPNILLSVSGEVKISDFGVARWAGTAELTRAGTVRGKVAYMAPELLDGGEASAASDLFALGAMAHEVVTGRRLYKGKSDPEVALEVIDAKVESPSVARPDLPPEVEKLIMALLEHAPAKRLASSRVLANTIRNLQGPTAPYPSAREALIALVARVGHRPVAGQDPSTSPGPDAKTRTVSFTPAGGE